MKYLCFVLAFLIFSCKSKEDIFRDKLYGQWAIEEIKYNSVNYKEDIYINFLVFEKENKISIPESVHFEKDNIAEWNLKSIKEKKITINCVDVVFKGSYKVEFIKDPKKKLLGIEMKSDSTFIKAYKFFQNYDSKKMDW